MGAQTGIPRDREGVMDKPADVVITDITGPCKGHTMFQDERFSLSSNSCDRNNTVGKKMIQNSFLTLAKVTFPEG